MNLIKINLANRHLVGRVVEIILKQLKVAFENLVDQMHRHIVKIVFNIVQPLRPMAFTLVEARDFLKTDLMRRLYGVEYFLHPVVELFGPKNVVITPAIGHKCAHMSRHRTPVNVRVHRAPPSDGIPCKEQKSPEALNLVKLFLTIVATHFDPVFLDQKGHKVAPIAAAIALNPTNFVKKARKNARVRVSHTSKRI